MTGGSGLDVFLPFSRGQGALILNKESVWELGDILARHDVPTLDLDPAELKEHVRFATEKLRALSPGTLGLLPVPGLLRLWLAARGDFPFPSG